MIFALKVLSAIIAGMTVGLLWEVLGWKRGVALLFAILAVSVIERLIGRMT